MSNQQYHVISGKVDGIRIESRTLEEQIQNAVAKGLRRIEVQAFGQHGIGGRLWKAGDDPVHIRITGPTGQRLGAMGFPNTRIDAMKQASDDVGWLNAGATIVVHGNAGNGIANAMAQGKVYIAGSIGSRGMTMTKHNPRFAPPELWALGSAGDFFGEFMAGGIAVICGFNPQTPNNVLGYRPLVGMVGGRVFFRGPHSGFSKDDAKQIPISDNDWQWLAAGMKDFLESTGHRDMLEKLLVREDWQLIVAKSPHEKGTGAVLSMSDFRENAWDRELGPGGMVGDLIDFDVSQIPLITTGELRRYVPVWENRKYSAPCESACPTGIPVHDRWRLIRDGRVDEAVDLALAYTPFPATVCGYLCPNICMNACTRQDAFMPSVDITQIGKASIRAGVPELPDTDGKRIAVIGGGPAGISVAWQLRRAGHEATIYDMSEKLGGKISAVIPEERIPKDVLDAELERVRKVLPHVHLQQKFEKDDFEYLKKGHDFIVIATGAQKPRMLPIPGNELAITANDFLARSKKDGIDPGKKVVIIGAGNVGCDVAVEAHRLGAREMTLIDVQKPASFGKERAHAEAAGAKFRWPCFTKEITKDGVVLQTGETIPAATVIISIGDMPDLEFLPDTVKSEQGFVMVNDDFQTTDPKLFAIGDIVRPGLLTDAIGEGRTAAAAIHEMLTGRRPKGAKRPVIDKSRVVLEYFDPRTTRFDDLSACGSSCASCGACRDCGICVAVCPQAAISREERPNNEWEYAVDPDRCIGCGFCAGSCPCGVWALVENDPMG
ncbi:MAG: FAD-dependent oxidoreductase [Deltaproteobacteria bacterium]|nr:FAD-dependent oxidoreductase [Deltaproteobacteria bacterium]